MSAEILGAYKKTGPILEDINLDIIKPNDIYYNESTSTTSTSFTKYFLMVVDPITDEKVSIDLSRIFVFEDGFKKEGITWNEVSELITDKIIIGYREDIPDFTDSSRSMISTTVLNDFDFEMSYGTWRNPSDRNIKNRRYRLTDMIITKINDDSRFNLENCILSVNGLVSTPKVFEGELYSIDSALYTHGNTDKRIPSILMMDFSNLGGFTIIPLSQCDVRSKTGEDYQTKIVPNIDLELILPEGIDITDKTIFPVIANSLFLPNMITKTGKNTCVISPYKFPVGISLLKRYAASNKFVPSSSIIKTSESINEYTTDIMFREDHYGAFLIIVNTPKVYIRKTHAETYCWNVATTVPDTAGVMFDATSQSFIDHVKCEYTSMIDHYTIKKLDQWIIPTINPLDGCLYSIETMKCIHQNFMKNVADNDLYIMQIFR